MIQDDLDLISGEWVSKHLNADQKPARVEASISMYARFERKAEFLSHVLSICEI